MRLRKIDDRSSRHYACPSAPIINPLDRIYIYCLSYPGQLIEITAVRPEINIVLQLLSIALKLAMIG